MSETTPNLALPLIAAGQAQKHVTHNEALAGLDTLVQLACLTKGRTTPPAAPADGDRYLLAAPNPTGAWAGLSGQIVRYQDGAWIGFRPKPGWLAFVVDEADLYTYAAGGWVSFRATLTVLQNLTRLGLGTGADAATPFAAKLNTALWTARTTAEGGTGDLRYTLNKEAPGNTLSLLFQSGWSGRAELGLTGDDDLHLKVSADGARWREALRIDRGTGAVALTGGSIDGMPIGATNAASGRFSTLTTTEAASIGGQLTVPGNGGVFNGTVFGQGPLNYQGFINRCGGVTSIWGHDSSSNRTYIQTHSGGNSTTTGTSFYDLLLNPYGGNVGIGTGTPIERLTVGGTLSAIGGITNRIGDVATVIANHPSSNAALIQCYSLGTPTTTGTSTYNMMINPYGGAVMIGTAELTSGANKLEIGGTTQINGQLIVRATPQYAGFLLTNGNGQNIMSVRGVSGTNLGTVMSLYDGSAVEKTVIRGDGQDSYVSGTFRPASYTVATLPTAGTTGRMAWASNGRASTGAGALEAAGAGTGCLVTDNGTAWTIAGTTQTVQA